MNNITMTLQVDHLIMEALREDISSEDVTTNAVMHEAVTGEVDLICKQDGVIAGLQIFQRVFELLDKDNKVTESYACVIFNNKDCAGDINQTSNIIIDSFSRDFAFYFDKEDSYDGSKRKVKVLSL